MVIKNAIVCDSHKNIKKDVKIENGKIIKIGNNLSDDKIIDANGLYLMPSMIDLNVRVFNDILSEKTLIKLNQNALIGGVSNILLMPDCSPAIDSEMVVEFVKAKSKVLNKVNIYPSIASLKDDKLTNISILLQKDAKAIFLKSNSSGNSIKRVFEYSQMSNTPVLCFCNDEYLSLNGVVNDGEVGFNLGLDGIPEIAESSEVAKINEIAKYIQNKIVIQNISTNRALEIIKDSNNIKSEVSIHHLILNENECKEFNTYAKIMPPLRDEKNRLKLVQKLKDGEIDLLTSLHSPKSFEDKDVAFSEAKFGINSIKYYFSLSYTYLVKNNIINLQTLSKLTSLNPAKILNLNKGLIQEGYDADLILVDLNKKVKIDEKKSLYANKQLFGKVVFNIINGKVIIDL